MSFLTLLFLLPSALASVTGTLGIDIHRIPSDGMEKRDADTGNSHSGTLSGDLKNHVYSYSAKFLVGSEKQEITTSVDTGAHIFWFADSAGPGCAKGCPAKGYNPRSSTSYHNLSTPWDIYYYDSSNAHGFWGQDTMEFGGVTLKNVSFGLAEKFKGNPNFGVGFVEKNSNDDKYPYFAKSLQEQGIIEHQAFSLYLNGTKADHGQILFGGVDHARYDGTIGVMPIVSPQKRYRPHSWTVLLSGVSLRTGDQSCPLVDFNVPVMLDSGTSYASLPIALIENIAKSINYTFGAHPKYYTGDCDLSGSGYDTLELDFSGVKIQVDPESLLDTFTDSKNKNIYKDGKRQCQLAITKNSNDADSHILGDVFLRNFYVVYDYDNLEVGLANAKVDSSVESDIEVIKSEIPKATRAPRYSSTKVNTTFKSHTDLKCTKTGSKARPSATTSL